MRYAETGYNLEIDLTPTLQKPERFRAKAPRVPP